MPSGSPQITLNESSTFVQGLLSPFSPLLRQPEKADECLEFVSLQPCRKVSVVVRVLPCNELDQRCLFPHVKNSKSNVVQKSKSPHDMVVVKPTAFGKVIPSQVTMETAKLVAQVANMSSEDWARLYEFHHVIWPNEHPETHSDLLTTMDFLSRAVAQDAVLEHQSSVLISIGGHVPTCIHPTLDEACLLAKVIGYCKTAMESKAVASISMVELSEEKDTFCDLFNPQNKDVVMRHVDMKGAVLEGLTQIPLDHLKEAWHEVQSVSDQTVVVTLNIWDNAVAQELRKAPDSQITFVELTRSSSLNPFQSKMRSQTSTVSLGQVLRHLSHAVYSTVDGESTVSYRESNITKVLQRALETSKVVLLAAVSQLSSDYETTLATLNFLRSLLVKPGKTASSPFQYHHVLQQEGEVSQRNLTDQLLEYANDESFLEQITSDPRQRLAKVFKRSPAASKHEFMIETAASEEYSPVDYMKGLDIDIAAWESPVPRAETRKTSTIPPPQQASILDDMTSDSLELCAMSSQEIVFSAENDLQSLDYVTDENSFSRNDNSLVSNSLHSIHFADDLLRSEPQLLVESGVNELSHSTGTRSPRAFESTAPHKKMAALNTADSYNKNMTSPINDESYSGDIIVLENAVHQIQNMQSGLWSSSAESLTKLRETLGSQRAAMNLMKSRSDTLSDTVAALKNQVVNVSEERDIQIQIYQDKVQHLHSQLANAIAEKSTIQNALDEAKGELQITKDEVRTGMDSYRTVQADNTKLLAQLEEFRVELRRLKQDKEMIVQTCDKLQLSLTRNKEENNTLMHDISVKAAEIQDLNGRLVQLNNEHKVYKERLNHLNESRKQEKAENDLVQRSNRSLSMLLEDKIKEISTLAEDSRRDKAMIECLQRQLQDSERLQENIIGEKQKAEKCSIDLEQRLHLAQEEGIAVRNMVASLEEKCQDLQNKWDLTRSDKLYLEEQTAKLTQILKELNDDLQTSTQAKTFADDKIKELEDRIGNVKSENLRLRESYLLSEREKNDVMANFDAQKREHLQQLKGTQEKVSINDNSIQERDQRSQSIEQPEYSSHTTHDAHIFRVMGELRASVAKLKVSNAECAQCRQRLTHTEQLLSFVREEAETSSSNSIGRSYAESLHQLVEELEIDLACLAQEHISLHPASQRQLSAVRDLSDGFERTQEENMMKIKKPLGLEQRLEEDDEETSEPGFDLPMMRVLIRTLQSSTNERFRSMSRDATTIIRDLQDGKEHLEFRLRKTERERDACLNLLEKGRQMLAEYTRTVGEEVIQAHIIESQSTQNLGTAEIFVTVNTHPAKSSEIRLTRVPMNKPEFASRAEEIATCLAVSAKTSLDYTQNENLNLRSKLYRLEAEKKTAIATLQARIRLMEVGG